MAYCVTSVQTFADTDESGAVGVLLSLFDGTEAICDKEQIVRDLCSKENATGSVEIGGVIIHNTQSNAVRDLCISCAVFEKNEKKRVELFVSWKTLSEHNLNVLSRLVDGLSEQKAWKQSEENIVLSIKKILEGKRC